MGGDGLPHSRGGRFHFCELTSTATRVGLPNRCQFRHRESTAGDVKTECLDCAEVEVQPQNENTPVVVWFGQ